MNSIYFNFYTIGWMIAVAFQLVSSFFCFMMPNRSKAAFHLGFVFFFAFLGSLAYAVSSSIYHPGASIHRYFTILFILAALTHNTQFFFLFPEERFPRVRKTFLIIMWVINFSITGYFIYQSLSADYVYHFSGHYWDFTLDYLSKIVGIIVLTYSLIAIFTGIYRSIVTKDKVRWSILTIALMVAAITILPAIVNILSRDGAVGREYYLLLLDFFTVIGYFIVLIIFINNTKDKSTFMTKIIGICMVSFLVILLGISYATSLINERSYDTIHRYQLKSILQDIESRPDDLKYINAYSIYDESISPLFGNVEVKANFTKLKYEYLNTFYWSQLENLPRKEYTVELQKILDSTHPYFRGYKNEILSFTASLKKNDKNTGSKVIKHIDSLRRVIFYYSKKIMALPDEGFKDSLTDYLKGTRDVFKNFRIAIESHIKDTDAESGALKKDVLHYLATMQPPGSRHYRFEKGKDNHYISFLYYDDNSNNIIELGFSYEQYRAYIHPDSLNFVILLGVVILIITIGFRFFFLGSLVHPLQNVLSGIQEVQEGHLEVEIPVKVQDEIGFITQNFNNMTKAIHAARKEIDDYAEHLEDMVEQRTKELQKTNDELAAAMGVMEAMNEELVTTNKDLNEAHQIAARDMEMAVNVQTSFFPKEAPRTEGWEISYIFKPMAGVSGDMYDFYIEDGDILGLSLFDVSGHGIASGLITMIAKTIVYRSFMTMKDAKLNDIIEKVNHELIEEIGKVDNYLTGLLVRFAGNKVEFINAGHTDPIYYDSNNKKIKIVDLKDNSIKGMFLGIEDMKDQYRSLSFSMQKDDLLLLYSDCLIESKSKNNEEFGIKNVVLSMRDYINYDSHEILEHIIQELYNFTDTDKLTDDLTVIMIRRLT